MRRISKNETQARKSSRIATLFYAGARPSLAFSLRQMQGNRHWHQFGSRHARRVNHSCVLSRNIDVEMQLRQHPLISYKGSPVWPPIWVGVGRGKRPHGEVGRLTEARCYPTKPGRIYLVISHHAAQYTGCLLLDDALFCEQLCNFLQGCCGMPIEEIGSLDLPSSLDLTTIYRRASGCQTWHFLSSCSHWPAANFTQQAIPPATDELCNQCKALWQEVNRR